MTSSKIPRPPGFGAHVRPTALGRSTGSALAAVAALVVMAMLVVGGSALAAEPQLSRFLDRVEAGEVVPGAARS